VPIFVQIPYRSPSLTGTDFGFGVGAGAGAGSGPSADSKKKDDVVDAEFVDVDDKK